MVDDVVMQVCKLVDTPQKAQQVVDLARSYEVEDAVTPDVHHCSHKTILKFTEDQQALIAEYGELDLTHTTAHQLAGKLESRGN